MIGSEIVANARPDGYTLIQTNISTISINQYIYDKLPYNAERDFAPVSITSLNPLILVVHPNIGAHNIRELIALAKTKPGQLAYGSLGSGSIQHLTGHVFGREIGAQLLHIPYKGAAPVIAANLANEVQVIYMAIGAILPHIKSGKFRGLAGWGAKRIELLPDVPTLNETVPGFNSGGWFGIIAPAGTPKEIVTYLNREINVVLKMPEVQQKMKQLGLDVHTEPPEYFNELMERDFVSWGKVLKKMNFKPM